MRRFFASLVLLLQCAGSFAALGAAPTNFSVTPTGPTAHMLSADTGYYRVNATTLASGTVVREYVARSGVVFAVSWNGPFMPDLRTLLGKHFDTMAGEAAKVPMAGHSQLSIERPDVVIVSGGHMRAYAGRAWIAAEFPSGFTADDIE